MAAEEDPRPPLNGIVLCEVRDRPGQENPKSARPSLMVETIKWSSPRGRVSAPSPVTATSTPDGVTSTLVSSAQESANPKLSKPGPRFAVVAGAETLALAPAGSETRSVTFICF